MQDASLQELGRRIASGQYPIDSAKVAEAIVSKTALIRRVKRSLIRQDQEIATAQGTRSGRPRAQRPSRSAEGERDPRRERLS